MLVLQSIATARGRDAGAAYVRDFIGRAKADGVVAAALERHGVHGVSVASR